MGLDMYLFDKDHNIIGRWRYAYHIYQWFIDNVQNGETSIRKYRVSLSKLEMLLELCKDVNDHSELIDGITEDGITEDGISMEIGNDLIKSFMMEIIDPFMEDIRERLPLYKRRYMDAIISTIEILETVINKIKNKEPSYKRIYFIASW